jgi:hypothetical protein
MESVVVHRMALTGDDAPLMVPFTVNRVVSPRMSASAVSGGSAETGPGCTNVGAAWKMADGAPAVSAGEAAMYARSSGPGLVDVPPAREIGETIARAVPSDEVVATGGTMDFT